MARRPRCATGARATAASETQWHYRHGGDEKGPAPFSSLKDLAGAGQRVPADPVRRKGSAGWAPAGEAPGLFPSGGSPDRIVDYYVNPEEL